MSTAEHALHGNEQEDHSHSHPTESTYIRVALILVAITTLEVAIYYIQWFHDSGALVPVMPRWLSPEYSLHALWHPGKPVAPRVTAFVDFLVAISRRPS